MNKNEIEKIEIDILLETLNKMHGYNFSGYAKASLKRRIRKTAKEFNLESISEMIPKVIHDNNFLNKLLFNFSITVSEMFRDPPFFKSLRETVIPFLKTYPYIKIWHAGCATGEEVYSMAILLQEEGLYDKCTIFATDFNNSALAQAKEGIYDIKQIKEFTENYQMSGGKSSFSDYYITNNNYAKMNKSLRDKVTFANHNLVTDGVFSEMHLILCRNVLIYFGSDLQNRVLNVFTESLVNKGFLAIGSKESIEYSSVNDKYKAINKKLRIFRKKI
ncbi:MAG: protein-glutamate O-methyltransferase CheR [Candidatus Cloacimonetes bacterium]|nr:protein-glutamate O-methyltransferase CheR [Candidatus Cloacimonadota bacterium]